MSETTSHLLIYGAYGYTGELIVREAIKRGMKPILAGRNAEKVKALADQHHLDFRVFDLNNADEIDAGLTDCKVVLHCAGPFVHTAAPMAEACLRTRTHYLDLTGEIAVFEAMASRNEAAKLAGIMLLPGVGFDVVPSDCLAAMLKADLPDTRQLRLAIHNKGGSLSHGTAVTMIENIGDGALIRKEGKLVPVPAAWKVIDVEIAGKKLKAASIPWGDVSTAWYSTGVPNIQTYSVQSPKMIRYMKLARWIGWILRSGMVQRMLRRRVDKTITGPSDSRRERARSFVWGEATDSAHKVIRKVVSSPEGYTLTALCAVEISQRVLDGDFKKGFQTPSLAYGKDLILKIPGTEIQEG